jgi:hypothetical protein
MEKMSITYYHLHVHDNTLWLTGTPSHNIGEKEAYQHQPFNTMWHDLCAHNPEYSVLSGYLIAEPSPSGLRGLIPTQVMAF